MPMKIVPIVLLLPFACCAAAPEPAPTPDAPPAAANTVGIPAAPALPTWHTVAKGETLWAIAQRYYGSGLRWRAILDANPMKDGANLRVGERLRIPAISPSE